MNNIYYSKEFGTTIKVLKRMNKTVDIFTNNPGDLERGNFQRWARADLAVILKLFYRPVGP